LTVAGTGWTTEHFRSGGTLTGIPETPDDDGAPIDRFAIESTTPNPFTGRTRITFALPDAGPVQLTIYDVSGRRVRELMDAARPRGRYSIDWDGRDQDGGQVTQGIYFARITSGAASHERKLVMMK
jgi:hypothetical protein